MHTLHRENLIDEIISAKSAVKLQRELDGMHDSLKGFLVTASIAGIVAMYIVTHRMNTFTTFFALPLAGTLAICVMPNKDWLLGALAVYVLPIIVLVFGVLTAEDLDVGGTFLLVALAYISASSIVGLVVRAMLRTLFKAYTAKENECT